MTIIFAAYDELLNFLKKLQWLPLLVARLSIASVFVVTGWGKLHNIPKVVGYFTDLGIPMPAFNAHLVALIEFGCGSLILVGLFTRLASVPLAISMAVAIITAKASEISGITDLLGLDEFLYIAFFLFFIVYGAGAASFDAILSRLRRR